ncbi:MAG: hypothetical protein FWD03_09005 [Defluviitaleaceae bacterium]|nr:hypothetical protein [Defluviitaleaceae bacterium]
MGMTDSQFKAYIRLLVAQLEEAKTEEDKAEILKRLDKVLKNLQAALED